MNDAACEHRNSASVAISSVWPRRPIGCCAVIIANPYSAVRTATVAGSADEPARGPANAPGAAPSASRCSHTPFSPAARSCGPPGQARSQHHRGLPPHGRYDAGIAALIHIRWPTPRRGNPLRLGYAQHTGCRRRSLRCLHQPNGLQLELQRVPRTALASRQPIALNAPVITWPTWPIPGG